MPAKHHVVVDGSNLATEGRTTPSLAQLDEAVRAYLAEDPSAEIVVVVDASFSHRIEADERTQLEAAELHGEVVAPPAGAIGRGDAFVLRIAERTGAVVLSNDSFQEFHEEHPWLFDEGRLVGGKPVPGVGWIFTPRRPVRGPRSRKATPDGDGDAERDDQLSAPRKAAEVAKALKKAAEAPQGGRVRAAAKVPEAKTAKKKLAKAAPAQKGPAGKKGAKAATKADSVKLEKASLKTDGARRAKGGSGSDAKKTRAKGEPKATKDKRSTRAAKAAPKAGKAAKKPPPSGGRSRRQVGLRAAIDQATAEVIAPVMPPGRPALDGETTDKGKRRRRADPPPAVNEPLAFITFVAAHPLGSTFEGVVASFTSHGAMVEVALPGDGVLHCYAPLAGLGAPAPRAAREVLTRGEHRQFSLVGLDPPRRMAELALPQLASVFLGARSAPPKAAG
jgi:hypothetical protein